MNCGVLVLRVGFNDPPLPTAVATGEIVGAEFLFSGHMESALSNVPPEDSEVEDDNEGDEEDGVFSGDDVCPSGEPEVTPRTKRGTFTEERSGFLHPKSAP